jgi:hypothetical protein
VESSAVLMIDLLIVGDSWGIGEWGWDNKNRYACTHKGLEQYFLDAGYSVQNKSIGGGTNRQSTLTLQLLDLNQYKSILWFQTDPLRDITDSQLFLKEYNSFQKVIEYQKELLNKTYLNLNSLEIEILCIGGCSKLELDLIKYYPNLTPIIPSAIEFLIPDFKHPEIWFSRWYEDIDRQFSIDCINKFLYNKQLQDQLEKYRDLFWPDGRHPNRWGHKKIFEYLNENLS